LSAVAYAAAVDRCDECGFEYDLSLVRSAGDTIVRAATALAETLGNPDVDFQSRRLPQTWSPLEYGCHLRDMLLVQRERVLLARRQERPSLQPMGRDERVDHDGYADQDAAAVARQLVDAAGLFANVLGRLGDADWDRTVLYNYPHLAERSLRWVAVHTLHEVRHHTLDVDRQLT
jgi:hypothetical protein